MSGNSNSALQGIPAAWPGDNLGDNQLSEVGYEECKFPGAEKT